MNFDPVARPYCWLERMAFGGALQRCRIAFLERLTDVGNVLILGEGDGRFLRAFLKQNAAAQVTVMDSSERMISLARRRVEGNRRVTFLCGDVRELELPTQQYDLIVTHFFLDCFPENVVREIIHRLASRFAVEGRWLWSDFAVPDSGWMRVPASTIVWALYRFFRLTTAVEATRLVDVGRLFGEVGLERESERSFLKGLLRSELWRGAGWAQTTR